MQKVLMSEDPVGARFIRPFEEGLSMGRLPDLSGKKIAMFCDFDGTITIGDVVDILLEELADPQWRVIEKRWENGEIDDCQCMSEQIALIRGDWQDIVRVLDNIEMDPDFKSFVEQCNKNNIPIYIGSNGLDRVINYFLAREGSKVKDVWAYRLLQTNNHWSLEFPHNPPRDKCRVPDSPACKCALLESHQKNSKNNFNIVIGDSRSDFCWVQKADFVFAKNKLAQYCDDNSINHASFATFADICKYFPANIIK